MVFLIMFNKAWTDEGEIRFSPFKFKLPKRPRPAWDFQYVIHNAAEPQPKRGTAILAVRTGRMPVPPGAWKIFAAREEA